MPAKVADNVQITAADIRAALLSLYTQPEWALLFEVRDATGGRATRSADALAMSLWPSRGLELYGMEIKVSRSDWRREREKPQKAETIAAYCHRWQIVAPPGVVPIEELPPAWGLLTWDGKRFSTQREPARTEAKPIDYLFLAAILRRAHKTDQASLDALIADREKMMRDQNDTLVEQRVQARTRDFHHLKQSVDEFELKSGLKLSPWDAGNIGAAVKVVQAMGVRAYSHAFTVIDAYRKAADEVEKALTDAGVEREPESQPSILQHAAKKKARRA